MLRITRRINKFSFYSFPTLAFILFLELDLYNFTHDGCGPVFKRLMKKHPELEFIYIFFDFEDCSWNSKEEDQILLTIFSKINLKSISIHNVKGQGEAICIL